MLIDNTTFRLDGCIEALISIWNSVFNILQHNFYSFHNFRLSIFDFALSLMVLDAACQLIFPWYSPDDENE